MTRTLVLVGGGLLQSPVVEIAHRKNVRVLCLDADPSAYCRSLVDEFVVADIKDKDTCLEKVEDRRAFRRIDGVVTVGTDFSTTVAWIAQRLGLPGIPYEVALRAKDKAIMRQTLTQAGVRSPDFEVVTSLPHRPYRPRFGFPAVVKPADNMGARGVRLVSDEAEAIEAITEAFRYSTSAKVVVEQFVEGPEFSLDAIVRDAKVYRMGFADRSIVLPPHFVEIGHSFPSRYPIEVVEEVWSTFERGVAALGITWGAAKGDVKYSNGRGVVGEIAARLSGGYMSGWTFPLHSGQSSILWAVENALGDPLSTQVPARNDVVVERSWINLPGRVASIEGLEDVHRSEGVRHAFVSLRPGAETRIPRNNVEKGGNLIVCASSPELARRFAARARTKLVVRLEAPNESTNRFFLLSSFWWFDIARFVVGEEEAESLWKNGTSASYTIESVAELKHSNVVDLYENSLHDVVVDFEAQGIDFDALGPVAWFFLLKGGAQGFRYFKELHDRSYFPFQR